MKIAPTCIAPTMNASHRLVWIASVSLLLVTATFFGCGAEKQPPPAPAATALTLEEWKTMPIDLKYDGGTLDRLRMADPRLQDERAWMQYFAQNIMPERRKDIPGIPGQPAPEPLQK